jgi:hypothetical protein
MFIRKNNDVITVKPEPIIIGTNDDGEPARKVEFKVIRRRNLHCQWLTPVTKAMQKLKKKQTLVIFYFFYLMFDFVIIDHFFKTICFIFCKLVQHIPSWVVKEAVLKKNQIYLRSADTNRTYNCKILNGGSSFQRYIGNGWYGYLDDHKPKVDDCLLFSLKYPYNLMIVTLMRRKDLSG